MFSCKDTSVWLMRLQDEQLPAMTRMQLKFHLLMCGRCKEFSRQLDALKLGVVSWREHID